MHVHHTMQKRSASEQANKQNAEYTITLYQPTHPLSARSHLEEDQIRFKSALQSLEQNYSDRLEFLQETIRELHSLYDNRDFWLEQSVGLAIVADAKQVKIFKLPIETTEFAAVERDAVLLPITMTQSLQQQAYILDISLHGGRLFQVTLDGVQEVQTVDLPSFDEILESDNAKNQQFHAGNGAGATPMYHGHGGVKDKKSNDVELYLQVITKRLRDFLHGKTIPLILAGGEHRLHRIRELLGYENTLEHIIAGNHEHQNAAMFQPEASKILLADRLNSIAVLVEQFNEHDGQPGRTVIGSEAIERKAATGAVDTVYVTCLRSTKDGVQPGYDRHILLDIPKNVRALDRLATIVAKQGGRVLPVCANTFEDDRPRALLRF